MLEDDVLREVRAARDEYCRRFDYDIGAIIRDLRARELAGGRRVVDFSQPLKGAGSPSKRQLNRVPPGQ